MGGGGGIGFALSIELSVNLCVYLDRTMSALELLSYVKDPLQTYFILPSYFRQMLIVCLYHHLYCVNSLGISNTWHPCYKSFSYITVLMKFQNCSLGKFSISWIFAQHYFNCHRAVGILRLHYSHTFLVTLNMQAKRQDLYYYFQLSNLLIKMFSWYQLSIYQISINLHCYLLTHWK